MVSKQSNEIVTLIGWVARRELAATTNTQVFCCTIGGTEPFQLMPKGQNIVLRPKHSISFSCTCVSCYLTNDRKPKYQSTRVFCSLAFSSFVCLQSSSTWSCQHSCNVLFVYLTIFSVFYACIKELLKCESQYLQSTFRTSTVRLQQLTLICLSPFNRIH